MTLAASVAALLVDAVPDPAGPGAVVGVVSDGRLAAAAARGMASIEHGVPLTTDSVLHVASVSKQFTAYAVTLLAESGRLDLDDAVVDHLGWFPFPGITIAHLIHHTSGLREYCDLMVMSGRLWEDVLTTAETVRFVKAQTELNFEPGAEHSYTNTGYVLLALIVEGVSGQAFGTYCAEQIFTPCSMTSSLIRADLHAIVAHSADCYSKDEHGGWRRQILSHASPGASSLNTTVDDLASWALTAMSPRGRQRLERRHQLRDGSRIGYAAGVEIDARHGHLVVSHSGSDAAYRAQLVTAPELGIAAIVTANTDAVDVVRLGNSLIDLLLPRRSSGVASAAGSDPDWTPSAAALQSVCGRYVQADADLIHELVLEPDGGLGIRFASVHPADDTIALTPSSVGHLHNPDYRLELDITDPVRVSMTIRGGKPTLLNRAQVAHERDPMPRDGTFFSRELDVLVHVHTDNGSIYLSRSTWDPQLMTPVAADIYEVRQPDAVQACSLTARFARDGGELYLSSHRTRRVRFTRVEPAW